MTRDIQHAPPLLAASYARKSVENAMGIEAQHDSNTKAAQANGHTIPDSPAFRFEDDGVSGALRDRPGLLRIREIAEAGAPFKYLYVKDMSRLGRFDDPAEAIALSLELRKAGIRIVRGGRLAPTNMTPQEMMTELMFEAVEASSATGERQSIRQRVRAGMISRLQAGFYPGAVAPYGLDRWLVNAPTRTLVAQVPFGRRIRVQHGAFLLRPAQSHEADIVRRMFEEADSGKTPQEIADGLNADQIARPGAHMREQLAGLWSAKTVRRLLSNPAYMGETWWRTRKRNPRKELRDVRSVNAETELGPVRAHGLLDESLVCPDQWHRVQSNIAERRPTPRSPDSVHVFILTGLLKCAQCGGRLHGALSTKQYANRRPYYRHDSRTGGGATCEHRNRYLPAGAIEAAVFEALTPLLQGSTLHSLFADGLRGLQSQQSTRSDEAELSRRNSRVAKLTTSLNAATMSMACASTNPERAAHEHAARTLGQEIEQEQAAIAKLGAAEAELKIARARLDAARDRWLVPLDVFQAATRREQAVMLSKLLDTVALDVPRGLLSLRIAGP